MTQASCVCALYLYRVSLKLHLTPSRHQAPEAGVSALAASRSKARTKPLGCWTWDVVTSGREWTSGCLLQQDSLCTAISALQQQLGHL